MGQDVAGASLGTQNILTKHAWDETPRGLEFELPGAQPLSPRMRMLCSQCKPLFDLASIYVMLFQTVSLLSSKLCT